MIDWISLAKEVHGDIYDYSNATVKNSKITYFCKKHGVVTQSVSRHVRGRSKCKKCWSDSLNGKLRLNNKSAINMLKDKHGCRYDYSLVDYKGNKKTVKIICSLHGVFEQRFDHHRSGSHCQLCANDVRSDQLIMSVDDFITKAKSVHGDNYEYSIKTEMSRRDKIRIFCKLCESNFYQRVDGHLSGHGCKSCNRGEIIGFKRSRFVEIATQKNNGLATFYIIKCFNNNETFYKVGITTDDIETRYKSKKMPYNYDVVKVFVGSACEVWDMEKKHIMDSKAFHYTPLIPFAGYTKECFSSIAT